jgi:hypothetical protein
MLITPMQHALHSTVLKVQITRVPLIAAYSQCAQRHQAPLKQLIQ